VSVSDRLDGSENPGAVSGYVRRVLRKGEEGGAWLRAVLRFLDFGNDFAVHGLSCLLIVFVCFLLLGGTLRGGFPRDFRDATLAFYVAKVLMLLDGFGFYTPSWYFGYEILRYYPPLSTFLPFLVAKMSGNLMFSYYFLCFVFYTVSCIGVYFFVQKFVESKMAGLFVGVVWPIVHVNFVSFQGHYWEIARLFGAAVIPWAMYFVEGAIEEDGRERIVAFVLLVSCAALSSMLSVLDLVLTLLVFTVLRGIVVPPVPRQLRGGVRRRTLSVLGMGGLGVLGLCLWWYVPALLPHGVGAFISGYDGKPSNLPEVFLQVNPPNWMPAVQLPITVLGLMGAVTALYRQERKGMMLVTLCFLSLLTAYLIRVQPMRLIFDTGFTLILLIGYFARNLLDLVKNSFDHVTHLKNRHSEVHNLIIPLILPALICMYLPAYANSATVDDSYRFSDEFVTATWLKENVDGDFRVYVMYGEHYRGSQWLNAFYPQVKQVLGGFDQGARIKGNAPFVFDDMVKQGSDPAEVYDLASTYHVKYIVVDRVWMQGISPQAYQKFSDSRFFRPVGSINRELSYAEVFEVLGISPLDETSTEYEYWDSWRVIGVMSSMLFLILFIRSVMRYEP